MFESIGEDELDWLKGWLLLPDAFYVPAGYARHVILLHPGARIGHRPGYVPVLGPSSVDGEPAPRQISALATVLLGASGRGARAYAAVYDGTPDLPWRAGIGAIATFVETDITYAVIGGNLEALVYHDWRSERRGIDWVSMLWPADHSWFLTSDPDSAFTVLACDDDLADTCFTLPDIRATEIPDYRWDRMPMGHEK